MRRKHSIGDSLMKSLYRFDNLLNTTECNQVLEFLSTAQNKLPDGGPRFCASTVGHFLACKLELSELAELQKKVGSQVRQETQLPLNVFVSRILQYTRTNYIQTHTDTSGKYPVGYSLIIPLNGADQYRGGTMRVNEQPVNLPPGDGIMYQFGVPHSVDVVDRGCRYAWNLRFYIDK